jgi:hypothetical protein
VGLNVPTEISDYVWWGIWSRKLEEAIIASPPVCLVGQVRLRQMLWAWAAAINSIGQQNTKTIFAAVFVQRGASERPPFTNVPNVMWVLRGAMLRRLPHKNKFIKCFTTNVCVRCVVNEERLKVPRNFCGSQNYVSNKIFTLHFIFCAQQRGLNLLLN